jgi:hypothetical protein
MRAAFALATVLFLASGARAEDTESPVVTYAPPSAGNAPRGTFLVSAKITDANKVFPQLFFRYRPGPYEKVIDMKPAKGKDVYEALIPYGGDRLEFYLEAYDDVGNGPGRAGSPEWPFRITLGALPSPPLVKSRAPAATTAPVAKVVAPVPASRGGRVWTWIAGGAGAGLLAGGLLTGLAVRSGDDAYALAVANSHPSANTTALAAQLDSNKSLGTKATLLTISGAVLLAGAVGLFFLESP